MPVQKWYDDDRIIYQPTAKAVGLLQKGTGVISNGNVVQRAAGANMSVDFDATTVIIDGIQFSYVAGNKLVDAAPTAANQTRLDLIYVDSLGVQYAAGVAAVPVAGVTYPDPANLGDTQVVLALIEVGNGVTSIVDARIVDTRMIANPAALVVGNGTASAPALRFAADADTGMFRQAENAIGVSLGGTEHLRFSNFGLLVPTIEEHVRFPGGGGSEWQIGNEQSVLTGALVVKRALGTGRFVFTDGTTVRHDFGLDASPYHAIGTNPASSGVIRIPNATNIVARNAANTGDVNVLSTNTSDNVILRLGSGQTVVGDGFLSVGVNPAASGTIRIPAGQKIMWRNAANTGDQGFIWGTTSDFVEIGDSVGIAMRFNANLNTSFASFAVGSTPATSGIIRMPNTGSITARNAANTDNIDIAVLTAGNVVQLGSAAASISHAVAPSSTALLGFFGTTPAVKPTVTGSRGGNAALADLLTDLATLGLITDSSTA